VIALDALQELVLHSGCTGRRRGHRGRRGRGGRIGGRGRVPAARGGQLLSVGGGGGGRTHSVREAGGSGGGTVQRLGGDGLRVVGVTTFLAPRTLHRLGVDLSVVHAHDGVGGGLLGGEAVGEIGEINRVYLKKYYKSSNFK